MRRRRSGRSRSLGRRVRLQPLGQLRAEVLALAQTRLLRDRRNGVEDSAGAMAVSWALSQIGTPYVWGGETRVSLRLLGLVQAAYAVAGVSLPRVAQDQYNATWKLAPASVLAPGDLVFFGGSPDSIDHVGLYVGVVNGQNVMVDAPHTGADIRAEPFPASVGSSLGLAVYRGDATGVTQCRPGASSRRKGHHGSRRGTVQISAVVNLQVDECGLVNVGLTNDSIAHVAGTDRRRSGRFTR